MSHLSILPTVLRDADTLAASLESLGLSPLRGGYVLGFGGERRAVLLRVTLPDDLCVGWSRDRDGSLALVGDLHRLRRQRGLGPQGFEGWLQRLNRAYAAREALRQAAALQQIAGLEQAQILAEDGLMPAGA